MWKFNHNGFILLQLALTSPPYVYVDIQCYNGKGNFHGNKGESLTHVSMHCTNHHRCKWQFNLSKVPTSPWKQDQVCFSAIISQALCTPGSQMKVNLIFIHLFTEIYISPFTLRLQGGLLQQQEQQVINKI